MTASSPIPIAVREAITESGITGLVFDLRHDHARIAGTIVESGGNLTRALETAGNSLTTTFGDRTESFITLVDNRSNELLTSLDDSANRLNLTLEDRTSNLSQSFEGRTYELSSVIEGRMNSLVDALPRYQRSASAQRCHRQPHLEPRQAAGRRWLDAARPVA